MLDIIKKSIYLGLGFTAVTKEKVENLVDELIEKGQLARGEKPKAVQEILDEIEESKTVLKQKTNAVISETLSSLGYATQKDINEMKEKLDKFEKKQTKHNPKTSRADKTFNKKGAHLKESSELSLSSKK
jgi:polyhydroxyalkanoate synthesis regulator phasin